MTLRNGCWAMLGLLVAAGMCLGQTQPWRGSAPQNGPMAGPNQPVQPQNPTLQRAPAPQPVPPQFQLTQQQQVYVDWALNVWQQHSTKIKTFEAKFVRWEHDRVFGPADQARYEDLGQIKYGAPDRGMFRVDQTKVNGEWKPSEEQGRAEHWICDGQAVYEYNFGQKKVFEHKLPPELQGKAISNGPLPFLFGSTAETLKRRYFLRPVTPPEEHKTQIWLEAYPRYQQDAADFKKATIILTVDKLQPHALQLELPNGSSEIVYRFYDIVVNDPLGFLKGNPFSARTPLSWTFVPDNGPARVTQQPAGGATR